MNKLTLLSTFFVAFCVLAFGGTASADTYSNDFESYADGTQDLGDGTTLADNQDPQLVGVIDSGNPAFGKALQMAQDDVGDFRSSFRIPAPANSTLGWVAEFDFFLSDAAGGNPPADGFSFSYGAIPPHDPAADAASSAGHGWAEEGWPGDVDHISFEIDTWMNGDTEVGYNIAASGTDAAFLNTNVFEDGTEVIGHAVMSYDAAGGTASMSIDYGAGNILDAGFVDADVSTFTAGADHIFAIGTRTGGANETLLIDNLSINSVPEPCGIALLGLGVLGLLLRRRR